MKKLNTYIIEKFRINKDMDFFPEENLEDFFIKYGITKDSIIKEELTKWFKENKIDYIKKIKAYGWKGINNLLSFTKDNIKTEYIEDIDEVKEYTTILNNDKNSIKIKNPKLTAFYIKKNNELFGLISKTDSLMNIIFKKI